MMQPSNALRPAIARQLPLSLPLPPHSVRVSATNFMPQLHPLVRPFALLVPALAIGLLSAQRVPGEEGPADPTDRPNVLFIAVDDLRPQLGCYGKSFMQTPCIDALASNGILFERAFCMVPTCGASRASLMTGLRPHPGRFVSYTARADSEAPGIPTLNQQFKNHGYTTISLGKVFHFSQDSAAGWSEKPWRPSGSSYQDRKAERRAIREHKAKYPQRKKVRGMPYESADVPDERYRDHETATQAIQYLNQLAASDEPFFLAVGFLKPHLPFCAPKRFWDLYQADEIKLPDNDGPPLNAPDGAVHSSGELRAYATIPPTGPVSAEQARKMIHGYYACVSFIDAQIGRLTEALDERGLTDNTIIVLWGDHGWQLGEHGMWNKHSCFETSMHAPLIVSAPSSVIPKPAVETSANSDDTTEKRSAESMNRVSALTEFIDIYPTLCELTGVPAPPHLEGTSFAPQLKNPETPGKAMAIGRFGDGDTIRTSHYRYSEYRSQRGLGRRTGSMLYDHRSDPGENKNVVDAKDNQSTVAKLSQELNESKGKVTP